MPISASFAARLQPSLPAIIKHFGTPFHIYDEAGIIATGERMKQAFADIDFREYFAVKALPNPVILNLMGQLGFGFDCSSLPELALARAAGASGDDIMFTSNNTSRAELRAATDTGCILNLDDLSLIDKVKDFPELISFRYNPGKEHRGCDLIGRPLEAKFGIREDQVVEAYRRARARGATRFGLHTMICSNELNCQQMVNTARLLLEVIARVRQELGITFEFINLGGGIGIPYRPQEEPFDIELLGRDLRRVLDNFISLHGAPAPKILLESGRYMTGPHGVLVTRVINRFSKWREYVGVDACMTALMRPALYADAYHHITVLDATDRPQEVVDVVGSLCENSDKFALQRSLPKVEENDVMIIHDTGAHGHSMGFNYNGRLRPQELLLTENGDVELIRREENFEQDYFATLRFDKQVLRLNERSNVRVLHKRRKAESTLLDWLRGCSIVGRIV
jgi:diaminopimelate decarboxylase